MSDFLDRLLKQAKGYDEDLWDDLPGTAPVVEPTETNAVKRDSFDRLGWDMVIDQVPVLKEHVTELGEDFETSPAAYEDLFNMLNQGDPQFTEGAKMLDAYKPQHHMLGEMFAGDDFERLRADTRYDEYNTAFAMASMKSAMREAFEGLKDAIDQQQAAQQQLQQAIDDAQGCLEGTPAPDGEQIDPTQAAMNLQAAIDAQQQAQEAGQQAAQQAQQELKGGVRGAKQGIKDEQETMSGWGVGDGELQHMSYSERRDLAEQLNRGKLAKMAALLGAWKPFADAERKRKIEHEPAEVYDVEMGNDLTKLVSGEMLNLAVPETEDLFWIRWARRGLLQKKVRGVEKSGRGPVIVVCDESSSMDHPLDAAGNTREAWSKAVTLALCDQARDGGRDFTYIGFASAHQQFRMDFPGGHAPIARVVEFASHFFNGGTSYEEPLGQAMDIVREYARNGKPKPDIVFITDDDCKVSPAFIEQWAEVKEAANVRCYGIQIGGDAYKNHLKVLADRCINISRLNASPEGVQELFRTI